MCVDLYIGICGLLDIGGNMAESTLGEKIKNSRLADGMTQRELASRIGCNVTTVSRWEHDKFKPSHDEMLKLCEILSLDYGLFESDTGKVQDSEIAHELKHLAMNLEDMRLDIVHKERRKYHIIIFTMIVFFILVLIGLWLWGNWKDPMDPDDEPVAIYYYSVSEGNN